MAVASTLLVVVGFQLMIQVNGHDAKADAPYNDDGDDDDDDDDDGDGDDDTDAENTRRNSNRCQ